ncbi:scavenger mRNA-decapping enzyme DcpS [Ceratobasidium sp. AG-Ba]|nr:scavenger mRNA-decapping enzyme DcpS [Ceratobasidium sp. AG-Ba]QRW03670.1 scavenger mRNA-decapping enzyme DcpS [Ceratobasidium sp. AG-Ba]
MFDCTRGQNIQLKDDVHGPVSALKSCAFCDVTRERGFNIVFENDELVVFRDRNPAAQHHLLVITRQHIRSIKSLTNSDIPLLNRMHDAGSQVLDDLGVSKDHQRFGFHIPPFNSVNHIHLHAQGLPYLNVYREKKYRSANSRWLGKTKGFSWFVEYNQCVQILESGGRVGVFPC